MPSNTVNSTPKSIFVPLKKIILQILICVLLYYIFYLIETTNYTFSPQVIERMKVILSTDININYLYEQLVNSAEKEEQEIETLQEVKNIEEQENIVNNEEEIENTNGIGGGENTHLLTETLAIDNTQEVEEEKVHLTQMELDAKAIIENYSIVKPVNDYFISSQFGEREATSSIISTNHAGIDLAANLGTTICSAMSGTVEFVSSESGYGNHFKVVNGDVATLYAHCKTIYVTAGQVVNQGDAIAEVGSTGNSTGPHLHFEIIYQGRYVNPEYVIAF